MVEVGDVLNIAQRELGAKLAPGLKAVNMQLTGLLNRFVTWLDENPGKLDKMNASISRFAEAISNLDIGKMMRLVGIAYGVAVGVLKIVASISLAIAGFKLMGAVVQGLGMISLITGGKMALAFWPVTLTVLAIVGAVLLLNYLLSKLTGTNLLGGAAKSITGALGSLGQQFENVYEFTAPQSLEGRNQVMSTESRSTSQTTSRVELMLPQGATAKVDGPMDNVSFVGLPLANQLRRDLVA